MEDKKAISSPVLGTGEEHGPGVQDKASKKLAVTKVTFLRIAVQLRLFVVEILRFIAVIIAFELINHLF